MKQWEYLAQKDVVDDVWLNIRLNNLGKLGWELVNICGGPNEAVYIFKRPALSTLSTRTLFDEKVEGICP